MEVLSAKPATSTFIPLAQYQSTTPESFYSGPPVLHYYSNRCKIRILEEDLPSAPALAELVSKSAATTASGSSDNGQDKTQTNGGGDREDGYKTVEDMDVWVTSDKLFLYSASLESGVSIEYPSISLHAIQSLPEPSTIDTSSQGLYMQLMSSTANPSSDEEPDSISLTIIPPSPAKEVSSTSTETDPTAEAADKDASVVPADETEESSPTPVQELFTALSNCSNLHPDPIDPDDQDAMMQFDGADGEGASGIEGSRLYQAGLLQPAGASGQGLPPPMPGSGGWITAENMHEYFDAEGNWIGPEDDGGEREGGDEDEDMDQANGDTSLGPGAGTVRSRDQVDDTPSNGGHQTAEDDAKWRRTG